jgi:2-dehydropantoate 2-reductase
MKIAIVGAGALGGYVGSFLAEAGADVILYDVRREYVDQVKSEGLTICPAGGKAKEYHPPITAELAEVGAPDVVVIATKATATRAAIEGVKSIVKDDTLVASFQNGYGNLAAIEAAVGRPERIIAITTAHNFAVTNVTHIAYFMGVGGVDLGMMAGGKTPRLEELAALLKALKVPVKVHENGPEVVWNKILWNSVLNCTAAVTGMDVITMANIESIKTVFDGLAAEFFAVSKAMGVTVWNPPDFVDKIMMGAKMAAKMATFSPPKPSMLQDIEAGRLTEVDFINGAIIEMGKKHGVPTPVNQTMWALVKTIEGRPRKKD